MAANGLINGETPPPQPSWWQEEYGNYEFPDLNQLGPPMPGEEQRVGGSGYQQFDEGVEDIAQAFKTYLTNNPHADRNAPNIDTFDAFRAGVEFGRTPPVEEFGKPYVPPNVDEFEGIATEGTPGFVSPDYEQVPPGFSLDPNDPRNAHLNQGIPGQIQPTEDFRIDMSDILGTPRG